ncbi:MAG: hypothetical protein KAQ69_10580 [Spirochaetales bacterium]|nr:hypothetical protein [Spirochaetales bacterium]
MVPTSIQSIKIPGKVLMMAKMKGAVSNYKESLNEFSIISIVSQKSLNTKFNFSFVEKMFP